MESTPAPVCFSTKFSSVQKKQTKQSKQRDTHQRRAGRGRATAGRALELGAVDALAACGGEGGRGGGRRRALRNGCRALRGRAARGRAGAVADGEVAALWRERGGISARADGRPAAGCGRRRGRPPPPPGLTLRAWHMKLVITRWKVLPLLRKGEVVSAAGGSGDRDAPRPPPRAAGRVRAPRRPARIAQVQGLAAGGGARGLARAAATSVRSSTRSSSSSLLPPPHSWRKFSAVFGTTSCGDAAERERRRGACSGARVRAFRSVISMRPAAQSTRVRKPHTRAAARKAHPRACRRSPCRRKLRGGGREAQPRTRCAHAGARALRADRVRHLDRLDTDGRCCAEREGRRRWVPLLLLLH